MRSEGSPGLDQCANPPSVRAINCGDAHPVGLQSALTFPSPRAAGPAKRTFAPRAWGGSGADLPAVDYSFDAIASQRSKDPLPRQTKLSCGPQKRSFEACPPEKSELAQSNL